MFKLIEGQPYLDEVFSSMELSNLPQAFCLIGEDGCGKHLLAGKIAQKFNITYLDITEHLDKDFLEEMSLVQIPHLFVVDLSLVGMKEQNVILKFLEDFKPFCHIVLLVENDNLVLNTILNRCIRYYFKPYTKEFLTEYAKVFLDEKKREKGLIYAKTLGQLQDLSFQDIDALEDLCDKIITKISASNFANMLSISSKFNYKDFYDKFDVSLFFKVMVKKLSDKSFEDTKYVKYYMLTIKHCEYLNDKRLKKQDALENYLINYWKLSREGVS